MPCPGRPDGACPSLIRSLTSASAGPRPQGRSRTSCASDRPGLPSRSLTLMDAGPGGRRRRSRLHPRVVRGVGVRRRAAPVDRLGAQLVVPGLVARRPGTARTRRRARPATSRRRRARCRPRPPRRAATSRAVATHRAASPRAVLGDRVAEQLLLVRGGAPAAVDEDLDPSSAASVAARRRARAGRVEVGHPRELVVERRHAVRERAVVLGEGTRRPRVGSSPRGRRGGASPTLDATERRCATGGRAVRRSPAMTTAQTDGGGTGRSVRGRRSVLAAGDHAASQGIAVLPRRMRFSICRRYAPARSVGACVCWSSRTSPTWPRPSATGCGWRRSRPTSPATATPRWSC